MPQVCSTAYVVRLLAPTWYEYLRHGQCRVEVRVTLHAGPRDPRAVAQPPQEPSAKSTQHLRFFASEHLVKGTCPMLQYRLYGQLLRYPKVALSCADNLPHLLPSPFVSLTPDLRYNSSRTIVAQFSAPYIFANLRS